MDKQMGHVTWIDAVARANDETSSSDRSKRTVKLLPKLKVSPCPIFRRNNLLENLTFHQIELRQRAEARSDTILSTSCHGISTRHRTTPVNRDPNLDRRLQLEQEAEFLTRVHLGMAQKYALPSLPKEPMSDFVSSWVSQGASFHWSEQHKHST
ncbi:uncharacterized protein LOC106058623 [Biomphalaria glabrata]|uniref:Uncharacterized protein LOC106058623 n=1 Tax=Biomphalaria glabrata TaxID=6526 RepID=A0A9W3AIS9_BIOGL|nr:uncharacterized protein LOC106058623 [Biomphalaria glabrata]